MEIRGFANFYIDMEQRGDRVALIEGDRHISYAELARIADQAALNIASKRSLVFLEASNSVASIATYLGCLRAGHPVYLFNQDDDAALIGRLIERYRPSAVVRASGIERHDGEAASAAFHPDLRVLLSTSGSTGSPKFVKLSARNIASNASAIAEYLELTEQDRAITALKFNYSYGLSVINSHLAAGGSLLLADLSVSTPAFWILIKEGGVTSFAGVPYSFEMLAKSTGWAATPGLRYVTQAGGRLSPDLVRRMGALGDEHGWRFYVMYGQTEAAPRMSYLPPEAIAEHADCIGRAIPGGSLMVLDEDGVPIETADVPGELAYAGPNVMMGYAETAADLAVDATPPLLKTGDIAVCTASGLFRIVGRTARIVKPFGVRVNLDEFQEQVRAFAPGAACGGDDDHIVIAVPMVADGLAAADIAARISAIYNLPAFMVRVVPVEAVPLLPNGKIDYRAVLALDQRDVPAIVSMSLREKIMFSGRLLWTPVFYSRCWHEAKKIVGLERSEWSDVRAIYLTLTGVSVVGGGDSFAGLAGDSLSYVQASLALEAYLGFLPDNWDTMTVDELEEVRDVEAAV